jgi:hypothetical protein
MKLFILLALTASLASTSATAATAPAAASRTSISATYPRPLWNLFGAKKHKPHKPAYRRLR